MVIAHALALDDDMLVACVSCGLCLPHCPTYRVTGLEIASPRGRIAAMRAVDSGTAPIDAEFVRAMEECVQCRGCEAACPSGVEFGHLMEGTRAALHDRVPRGAGRRFVEWIGYRLVLPRHQVLRAATWLLWLAQRLHVVRVLPARVRASLPALRVADLRARVPLTNTATPDAWLFTGCVMDAWMRPAHVAAVTLVHAAGATAARPQRGGDCCGALHLHAGRLGEARRLARRVIASMPGDAPVVVDSAGCGAAMKDYGRLLGDAPARAFSARVRDLGEWLATQPPLALRPTGRRVVMQDPCHLRHVQRAHGEVRALLAVAYDVAEPGDDGLCCGAGGAYAALQPGLSQAIRDRKVAALRAAGAGGATIVCSANPGCTLHLRAGGVAVRHPAELLADALDTPEVRDVVHATESDR
jgi:glycolate oxidase iron-sulfur subunit